MPERRPNPSDREQIVIQATFELRVALIQARDCYGGLLCASTMSIYAFTDVRESAGAVDRAARHLRVWLAATGSSYDATARNLFVRAHPVLFGRASEVTLRGYERWRWRRRLHDTPATFARYMAPRHQRWIAAIADTGAVAPCLIGSGSSLPCWALPGSQSAGAQGGELDLAA